MARSRSSVIAVSSNIGFYPGLEWLVHPLPRGFRTIYELSSNTWRDYGPTAYQDTRTSLQEANAVTMGMGFVAECVLGRSSTEWWTARSLLLH